MAQRIGSTGELRFEDDWKGVALHRWAIFLEVAGKLAPEFLKTFNEQVSRRIERPDLSLDTRDLSLAMDQQRRSIERAYVQAAPHIEEWLRGRGIRLTDADAAALIHRFLADPLVQLDRSRRDRSTFQTRLRDITEKRDIADWSQHCECWPAIWLETRDFPRIPSSEHGWIPYDYYDQKRSEWGMPTPVLPDSVQQLLWNASSHEFQYSLGIYDPLLEDRDEWCKRAKQYVDTVDKLTRDFGAKRPKRGRGKNARTRVAEWMVRARLLGETVPTLEAEYETEAVAGRPVEKALQRLAKEMFIDW